MHGTNDTVIPVQNSWKYKGMLPELVSMVELDDDHGLVKSTSLDAIERVIVEFFGLRQGSI